MQGIRWFLSLFVRLKMKRSNSADYFILHNLLRFAEIQPKDRISSRSVVFWDKRTRYELVLYTTFNGVLKNFVESNVIRSHSFSAYPTFIIVLVLVL